MKSRRAVQEAIHASDNEIDQTELIRLLEEEMLEAAKNLEFERAAQLRDKIQEVKGAPVIGGGGGGGRSSSAAAEGQAIWQPKSKGRKGRNVGK